jgi:hypothetical protein
MDERFVAYLSLSAADLPPATVVLGRIEQLFPTLPLTIAFHSKGNSAPGESFVFSIDDKLYTVIAVDQPLPKDALTRTLDLDRVWPKLNADRADRKGMRPDSTRPSNAISSNERLLNTPACARCTL